MEKTTYIYQAYQNILRMAIGALQTLEVIEIMENYISRHQPAEGMHDGESVNYKIVGQSVIIFRLLPGIIEPDDLMELPMARATFVKAHQHWKVFWMPASLRWIPYQPQPMVKSLLHFVRLVQEDPYGLFWYGE